MGERSVDAPDPLAKAAAAQGSPAATRVVRDDHGKTFVLRPGPERSLAEAGVAHHRDFFGIDAAVGLEVIHDAARSPGPRSDRAPLLGSRFAEEGVDAVLEAVVKVGIDVPVIEGGE